MPAPISLCSCPGSFSRGFGGELGSIFCLFFLRLWPLYGGYRVSCSGDVPVAVFWGVFFLCKYTDSRLWPLKAFLGVTFGFGFGIFHCGGRDTHPCSWGVFICPGVPCFFCLYLRPLLGLFLQPLLCLFLLLWVSFLLWKGQRWPLVCGNHRQPGGHELHRVREQLPLTVINRCLGGLVSAVSVCFLCCRPLCLF